MEQSIGEIARRVRQSELTASASIEAALAAAEENVALNAFITLDREGALARARSLDALADRGEASGVLAGVPLVVKDNIDVAGLRTTAGTPAIDYVPTASAPVVARLEAAQAIVIGKTNMHELAFGVTSNNGAFGAVRNAADPSRIPGGSSGGTATAVAAGIAPGGLGSDTAGSVRLPAALCGVVGFRPTTWRVDQAGVVPSVPSFDVVGPIARCVADAAILYNVMTGDPLPERRDPSRLRLGVARPYGEDLSPGVAAALKQALEKLRTAGAILLDIDLSQIAKDSFEIGFPVGFYEMKRALPDFLARHQPKTSLHEVVEKIASPDVKAVYLNAVLGDGAPSETAYRDAISRIEGVRRSYLKLLDAHGLDGVVFPTAPLEAQPIEGSNETVELNGQALPTLQAYMRNVASTGVYGAPGLSLPLKTGAQALPVGLEVDGRPDGDRELLSIGLTLEGALSG
ncbi:MAG: amidase family protein [Pseudomonadota bacterium]